MRKFGLGAAALLGLVAPALSADLGDSSYGAPPATASGWSWTGCYAGGSAGGLWAKSDKWIVRTPGGAFEGKSLGGHDLDSWIGGMQAGCDYQFPNGFVFGVQGDYGWTDAKGSHASARETGVFITARSSLSPRRRRGSATRGTGCSPMSKSAAPGSANRPSVVGCTSSSTMSAPESKAACIERLV